MVRAREISVDACSRAGSAGAVAPRPFWWFVEAGLRIIPAGLTNARAGWAWARRCYFCRHSEPLTSQSAAAAGEKLRAPARPLAGCTSSLACAVRHVVSGRRGCKGGVWLHETTELPPSHRHPTASPANSSQQRKMPLAADCPLACHWTATGRNPVTHALAYALARMQTTEPRSQCAMLAIGALTTKAHDVADSVRYIYAARRRHHQHLFS
ncbi:hypothetical protein N431DRAFT_10990 [Stipitochalara longipes BDJ]|nr:hypothetical protein N431DRAFT_10990 [Stipitochalara longipes BDJ]